MIEATLKFKKIADNAKLPRASKKGDAGLDLCCINSETITPGTVTLIRTGIELADVESMERVFMKFETRSGHSAKGLIVLGGVLDEGYRGELKVMMTKLTPGIISFQPGDRVAQMLVHKIYLDNENLQILESDTKSDSERGENGFGSTGNS